MSFREFEVGGVVHLTCIVVTAGVTVTTALAVIRGWISRATWRRVVVTGCLLTWATNAIYLLWPSRFDWTFSLPIHFCHVANMLGAIAVALRYRWAQSLVYFWAIALCSCAFLTPTLARGPASLEFWSFWAYHLFIPVAAVHVVALDGFRPGLRDAWRSVLFTTVWMGALAVLNAATGWNYGFVGPAVPGQRTAVELFGPYPFRLIAMWTSGVVLFLLLALPFSMGRGAGRQRKRRGGG